MLQTSAGLLFTFARNDAFPFILTMYLGLGVMESALAANAGSCLVSRFAVLKPVNYRAQLSIWWQRRRENALLLGDLPSHILIQNRSMDGRDRMTEKLDYSVLN